MGYSPNDTKNTPLARLPISLNIINSENKYNDHEFHLKTMYSNTDFYIDGEDEVHKVGTVTINPLGNSWDYITFPLLCEIGLAIKPYQTATFKDIKVANYRTPNNILYSDSLRDINTSLFREDNNIKYENGSYVIEGTDSSKIFTANIDRSQCQSYEQPLTQRNRMSERLAYISLPEVFMSCISMAKGSEMIILILV